MAVSAETEKDELRQKTVVVARQHKASWIELGQLLYTIHKEKLFKTWGYLAFETYCRKELGVKETTASKLLKSYYFLEREEPRIVDAQFKEDAEPKIIPNYEAVNLLRLAKENKNITPHEFADIREAVIDHCKDAKEVRAQVKKIISAKEDQDSAEVRKARRNSVIRRLVTMIAAAKRELESEDLLPDYVLKQMADLSAKLEDQLE